MRFLITGLSFIMAGIAIWVKRYHAMNGLLPVIFLLPGFMAAFRSFKNSDDHKLIPLSALILNGGLLFSIILEEFWNSLGNWRL